MPDTHSIAADLARLNTMERHIIDRFIHRQRVAKDITARPMPLGERVADKVAAFGGSWTFIGIAVAWLQPRSATIGSVRIARHDGTADATIAVAIKTQAAAPNTSGSRGLTP
jgi:hypothetical protein